MSCPQWNEQWVAHLYGELETEEAGRLERHLETCVACREQLERLTESSRLLRRAAPVVPATPRWTVVEPRRGLSPAWAFVAGLACASVMFALGLFAAPRLDLTAGSGPEIATLDTARIVEDLDRQSAQQARLERRLNAFENRLGQPGASTVSGITEPELEARLDALARNFEDQRSADMRYLLGEITATEVRAGTWVDETRNALRFVALNNDPRFTER